MDPRRLEDLIAAYALGALTEDERREVEEHLAAHSERQNEVDELRSTADLLALAPEERNPSPELRRSILGAVEPASGAEERPARSGWLGGLFSFPRLAYAASALVVLIGLLGWNIALQGDVRQEQAQVRELRESLQTQADNFARSPQIHEVSGAGIARMASGQVMEMGNGQTFLVTQDLPRLPENKTYQIWLIENDQPRPSGLFEPDEGITAASLDEPVNGAEVVAVTVEPDDGSPAPTSNPILTSKL